MRAAIPVLLAVSSCAPIVDGPATSPERDPRLLAMLFEHARSIESHLARDFACVSLRQGAADRDPPPSLVADLAARWNVPVIAGSRCKTTSEGGLVVAPGTSGSGKWLRVANLTCRDSNRCTADISYYVANLGAGGQGVTVERTATGWRVTPSGSMWIS